jgi:SAM-dependent methyltransferase
MPADAAVRDHAALVSPSLLPVAATLLALAGVRTGETVVDVCCGAGLLTHPLGAAAGETGRVYGVDADAGLLAYARDRRPSAVRWVRGAPARLPLAGESAAKVVCGAPHRVPDLPAAIAEWGRVLVPGGRLALCVWGAFADDDAERAVGAVRRGGAVRMLDLRAILTDAGLRVLHASEETVAVPFPTAEAYAAWRLSFGGRVPATQVKRVAAALGHGPVVAGAFVRYASAVRP